MNTLIMNPPHSSQPSTPASSTINTTGTAAMRQHEQRLDRCRPAAHHPAHCQPDDAADNRARGNDGDGDPRSGAARQRQEQCDADEQRPEPGDELRGAAAGADAARDVCAGASLSSDDEPRRSRHPTAPMRRPRRTPSTDRHRGSGRPCSSFKLTLTICQRPVTRMYRAIRNARYSASAPNTTVTMPSSQLRNRWRLAHRARRSRRRDVLHCRPRSSGHQRETTVPQVDQAADHQRDAQVDHQRQGEGGHRRRTVGHRDLGDVGQFEVADRRAERRVLDEVQVLVADRWQRPRGRPAAGSRTASVALH